MRAELVRALNEQLAFMSTPHARGISHERAVAALAAINRQIEQRQRPAA